MGSVGEGKIKAPRWVKWFMILFAVLPLAFLLLPEYVNPLWVGLEVVPRAALAWWIITRYSKLSTWMFLAYCVFGYIYAVWPLREVIAQGSSPPVPWMAMVAGAMLTQRYGKGRAVTPGTAEFRQPQASQQASEAKPVEDACSHDYQQDPKYTHLKKCTKCGRFVTQQTG
jgi:hypothetical protein